MRRKANSEKIKSEYSSKKCIVFNYNQKTRSLDVKFDKYGIRIRNASPPTTDSVMVKYKGNIGCPDFECMV